MEHKTHTGILTNEFLNIAKGAFAIAAIVIEELDDRNIAIGISSRGRILADKEVLVLHHLGRSRSLHALFLQLLIFFDGLHDDLRIFHQVIFNHLFNLRFLALSNFFCGLRLVDAGSNHERARNRKRCKH